LKNSTKKIAKKIHRSESKPHFWAATVYSRSLMMESRFVLDHFKLQGVTKTHISPSTFIRTFLARHSYKTCKDLGTSPLYPTLSLKRMSGERGDESCRWGPCVVLLGIFKWKRAKFKKYSGSKAQQCRTGTPKKPNI